MQWPIKELEKLRANKVAFNDMELKGGSVFEVSGITASQVTDFSQLFIVLMMSVSAQADVPYFKEICIYVIDFKNA